MFERNEIVRAGNSSAKVKYFEPANNFIVLYDIVGEFYAGQTIVGDDHGGVLQLETFNRDSEENQYFFDLYFDDWSPNALVFYYVIMDDESNVTLDDNEGTRVTL